MGGAAWRAGQCEAGCCQSTHTTGWDCSGSTPLRQCSLQRLPLKTALRERHACCAADAGAHHVASLEPVRPEDGGVLVWRSRIDACPNASKRIQTHQSHSVALCAKRRLLRGKLRRGGLKVEEPPVRVVPGQVLRPAGVVERLCGGSNTRRAACQRAGMSDMRQPWASIVSAGGRVRCVSALGIKPQSLALPGALRTHVSCLLLRKFHSWSKTKSLPARDRCRPSGPRRRPPQSPPEFLKAEKASRSETLDEGRAAATLRAASA